MKRIIDGVTFNTETATLVAQSVIEDDGVTNECDLFQNRAGVYFGVDTVTTPYRDKRGDRQERVSYDWTAVGDAAEARKYAEQYGMTILRDIEDMPPEAAPGEKLATVYLRVTPTLKAALDKASTEDKLSGNLWAARCIEQCLDRRAGANLVEFAVIEATTRHFVSREATTWPAGQMHQALQNIHGLIANAAEDVTGQENALDGIVATHAAHERVVEALEKYTPRG